MCDYQRVPLLYSHWDGHSSAEFLSGIPIRIFPQVSKLMYYQMGAHPPTNTKVRSWGYPYFALTVINWSHDFFWRSSGNCPLECSNLSICFFSWAWETVRDWRNDPRHEDSTGKHRQNSGFQASLNSAFKGKTMEHMYKLDIDGIQTIKHRDLYQQLLLVVGGWSIPNS